MYILFCIIFFSNRRIIYLIIRNLVMVLDFIKIQNIHKFQPSLVIRRLSIICLVEA